MRSSEPFSLVDYSATLDVSGSTSLVPIGRGPPPSHDGLNVGFAELNQAPPHGGECHPDGDELIVLISGDVSIMLEEEVARTVVLQPGEAFIVPQGVWHRLLVHTPSRMIYLTRGRSMIRPLQQISGAEP